MKVAIIGSGYVGLTTGAVLAYLGHQVTLLDTDAAKVQKLQNGIVPFHEPGLAEIMQNVQLRCIDDWNQYDAAAQIVIIAVGTPGKPSGAVDLTAVESAAKCLGERISCTAPPLIVVKSTVPVGTAARIKGIVEQEARTRGCASDIEVVSNPEFLREGQALADWFYPDRVVIGAQGQRAYEKMRELYRPILQRTFQPPAGILPPGDQELPVFIATTNANAELIKYAANTFLAMKISFINEFAQVAEKAGADICEVARAIGLDKRIGHHFLRAGIGWGGSCFGKDTRAILHTGEEYGCEMKLVRAAIEVNQKQRETVIEKLQSILQTLRGKTVGILGLAFKPNTDDVREAPSLEMIRTLSDLGAHVKAFDPAAVEACQSLFPELAVEYCTSADSLFEDCHAVVLATEWPMFCHLRFQELARKMISPVLIDGRNALDGVRLREAGFIYAGIGRGAEKWGREFSLPAEQVL